jgi:hypothetical protein
VAARKFGRPWITFRLFGLNWEARIVPRKHKVLNNGGDHACLFYAERLMYFGDHLSDEQLATSLAHEVQHAIEEHADVDYEVAAPPEVADRLTDNVARGWLYVIRDVPELLAVFQRKP